MFTLMTPITAKTSMIITLSTPLKYSPKRYTPGKYMLGDARLEAAGLGDGTLGDTCLEVKMKACQMHD